MLKSGTQILDSDSAAAEMGLGRWKPDFMVVSYSTKKIALGPKEYLQSNTRAENLIEAYGRKLQPAGNILSWQAVVCTGYN